MDSDISHLDVGERSRKQSQLGIGISDEQFKLLSVIIKSWLDKQRIIFISESIESVDFWRVQVQTSQRTIQISPSQMIIFICYNNVLPFKVFKSMLLICKTVRAIRNFSIVFRNILIGVCMAALDPMFHLKNLQLEEVYSLYARRKGFH